MKRIIISLVVMFSMFSIFLTDQVEAKVTPRGVTLEQYKAKTNDDGKVTADDNAKTIDDGKVTADDDAKTTDDGKVIADDDDILTGARKVSKEKDFKPWKFQVKLVDRFFAEILNEEGNERYTEAFVFTKKQDNIEKVKKTAEELGLEITKLKVIREKNIKKEFLEELTKIWGKDEPIVGVYLEIKDPSKESYLQKCKKNPLFRLGVSLTGFSSLLDAGELVVGMIK